MSVLTLYSLYSVGLVAAFLFAARRAFRYRFSTAYKIKHKWRVPAAKVANLLHAVFISVGTANLVLGIIVMAQLHDGYSTYVVLLLSGQTLIWSYLIYIDQRIRERLIEAMTQGMDDP